MELAGIRRTAYRSALCLRLAAGAAMVIGAAISAFAPQPAQATPAFSTQTHLTCTRCHTSAAGGATNLTKFGKEFQANGNKLPKN